MILTPSQKLTKSVGDLGKIIVVKCFEWLPKVQKSPNLVTLLSLCKHSIDYFRCLQTAPHDT